MVKASIQYEFDLPAHMLWGLVGDFGNMSKWTGLQPETCIADGNEVGAIRTLRLSTGGIIIDRLDRKSEWSYSYSVINMKEAPLPFQTYKATLTVEAISDVKCRLTWGGEFEPDGISNHEAIAFAKAMYQRGLEMIKKSASNL